MAEVSMAEREYPDGFRFFPFDRELITSYLKPLIVQKQNSCSFIKLRDVYGASSNPWLIFPKDDSSWFEFPNLKEKERAMFVFAKLTKLSTGTCSKKDGIGNTRKKAGFGTWHGKSTRKQIRDREGNMIGESRYLAFELNEIDPEVIGCDWRKIGLYKMHEYSLSGINAGLASAGIVLCKIIHDPSKPCKIDLKPCAGDVTSISSEVHDKEEIVNTNLEGVSSELTENLTNCGVADRSTSTQHLNDLDALCEIISTEDIESILEYLDFDPQNEPAEENIMSNLGKRKSEAEENSSRNKKACLF